MAKTMSAFWSLDSEKDVMQKLRDMAEYDKHMELHFRKGQNTGNRNARDLLLQLCDSTCDTTYVVKVIGKSLLSIHANVDVVHLASHTNSSLLEFSEPPAMKAASLISTSQYYKTAIQAWDSSGLRSSMPTFDSRAERDTVEDVQDRASSSLQRSKRSQTSLPRLLWASISPPGLFLSLMRNRMAVPIRVHSIMPTKTYTTQTLHPSRPYRMIMLIENVHVN